jgi:hypothetical protein
VSVPGLAACGILNYPEYVRQSLRVINRCHCKFASMASRARRDARAERVAAASTTSNHVVNLLSSINFDLVSRHIADYNAISNCKSIHTYQTNMCSHLALGYENYPLENYFAVPLLITHKTVLSCQVIPP